MSKLVKKMAISCSNHEVDFRKLVEGHEQGVRQNVSGTVNLALADPTYNVRRDRGVDRDENNFFGSNNMKNMAEVLGVFMKP